MGLIDALNPVAEDLIILAFAARPGNISSRPMAQNVWSTCRTGYVPAGSVLVVTNPASTTQRLTVVASSLNPDHLAGCG